MNNTRLLSMLVALAVLFGFTRISSVHAQESCNSSGSPAVSTDEEDYPPYSTATISGSGFGCNEVLSVLVTAPDGSTRSGNGLGTSGPDLVTTDGNGSFVLSYALSGVLPDGSNYTGQQGVYTVTVSDSSGAILASITFTDGLGWDHSCALTTSGGVKCWGRNHRGQVGDGTNITRLTPVDVVGLTSGIAQITGGGEYTCALTTGGGVKCWGYNLFGQLGDGTNVPRLTPVDVVGLTSGVAMVTANSSHTCAVTTSGGAKCWGNNLSGQLGDGTYTIRHTPVDVVGLTSGVAQIRTGNDHTCALLTSGVVKCWGAASLLGNGLVAYSPVPVNVIGLPADAVQISTGVVHTCALTSSGGVWCWGANTYGQVGNGTVGGTILSAVPVIGLSGVVNIGTGAERSCAVKADGSGVCWGRDIYYPPTGSYLQSPVPVAMAGLSSGVVQINGGEGHMCVLMTTGGVNCWGSNFYGQLGDGTTTHRLTPVNVVSLTSNVFALPDAFTPTFNEPPAAGAGGPYLGNESAAIPLSGASASDPDGDALTYSWSVNSPLCSFDNNIQLNPSLTCSDNGSFTVTLEVSDGTETASSSSAVTVINVAPTASLGNNGPLDEGGSAAISFDAAFDPSGDDTLAGFRFAFDCNGGSLASATYAGSGTSASTSCAFADDGNFTVSSKIMDKDGGSSEYTTVVTVNNVAPTITISGASSTDEGSTYSLTLDVITDPGADIVAAYIVHWGDGSSDSYTGNGIQTHTYADGPNNYFITVDLTDEDGTFLDRANPLSVTVDNVAPTLDAITVDQALIPVNTAINASASFSDPGTLDTHTAAWDWGDSATTAGNVTQDAGSGSVNDSHSYSAPGVYTIKLTVTDSDGAPSNESVYQYVVVYDPSGGFVTGCGWFDSPVGAYVADPSLTGKANFGFVAKYKKGASVPEGHTEFQFKASDLNFKSVSYQWLVVSGAKAQFKGAGTINGAGNYGFMLMAIDGNINGSADKFRIKIWDMDNGDAVVYDNLIGATDASDPTTMLGGGNIVIHK